MTNETRTASKTTSKDGDFRHFGMSGWEIAIRARSAAGQFRK